VEVLETKSLIGPTIGNRDQHHRIDIAQWATPPGDLAFCLPSDNLITLGCRISKVKWLFCLREGAVRCASQDRKADIWGLLSSACILAIFRRCCDWSAISGLGICGRIQRILRSVLGLWEKISLRLVQHALCPSRPQAKRQRVNGASCWWVEMLLWRSGAANRLPHF